MTVKERLEDAADRLDDLELSELLRETIEEIERVEAESLEHELHGDRVEAELVTANAKVEKLEARVESLRSITSSATKISAAVQMECIALKARIDELTGADVECAA